jgi:putative nucleotidyltransferase with HDIG domain
MTPDAARALLVRLNAPPKLQRHAELVLEAAEALLAALDDSTLDAELVRAGAMLHDAGKTVHTSELEVSGSQHEPAGEKLLLEHGVEARIARCCVTHAKWTEPGLSLEELLVALADA